ncbi:hypothetical protein G6F57_012112 [Rhizopus arrhizus]|nr:hypothetical protein G6F57_012112 [Rhizopus arrhizus]
MACSVNVVSDALEGSPSCCSGRVFSCCWSLRWRAVPVVRVTSSSRQPMKLGGSARRSARARSGIADDKQRHNCEGGNGAGNYCGSPALPSCNAPYAQCLLSCGGTVNEVRTDTGVPVY